MRGNWTACNILPCLTPSQALSESSSMGWLGGKVLSSWRMDGTKAKPVQSTTTESKTTTMVAEANIGIWKSHVSIEKNIQWLCVGIVHESKNQRSFREGETIKDLTQRNVETNRECVVVILYQFKSHLRGEMSLIPLLTWVKMSLIRFI